MTLSKFKHVIFALCIDENSFDELKLLCLCCDLAKAVPETEMEKPRNERKVKILGIFCE